MRLRRISVKIDTRVGLESVVRVLMILLSRFFSIR